MNKSVKNHRARADYKIACQVYRQWSNLLDAVSEGQYMRERGIICDKGDFALKVLKVWRDMLFDAVRTMDYDLLAHIRSFDDITQEDGYKSGVWTFKHSHIMSYSRLVYQRTGHLTRDEIPF